MEIKLVDLTGQYRRIKTEIDAAIQSVLDSTSFIQGPQVKSFSQNLSKYLNGARVVPCGNGTDALQIALMAAGLQPGDEVILPVHTYVATAEVIALLGLKPIFVDVHLDDFNINVHQVEERITGKTKAIVPVHLYGQCAKMEFLGELAGTHGIMLIEDAAQSLGAEYLFPDGHRAKAGTIGHMGTTSFFPTKNLGCFGDGGAIITLDNDLADRVTMIANHGQNVKYYHEVIGVNSRLDSIQAAVLDVKLKYLPEYQRKRNDAADFYDKALGNLTGISIPARAKYSTHVFHQYTLKAQRRDELKLYLEGKGIPTVIYYPVPLHLQNAYRNTAWPVGSFPVSEQLSKEVLSLPMHTELTEEQLDYICRTIVSFYRG